MSLSESIVEDAAHEWFGALGFAVGHGLHLAPGEPAAEREKEPSGDGWRQSFGELVQSRFARIPTSTLSHGEREQREAIRRLNPELNANGSESSLEAVT